MKKEVMDYVVKKTHELMEAASCSKEAKEAAQVWLDAVGTEKEAEETKKYIEELEADIMPVDNLIAFAESEMGAKVFGGIDAAKGVAEHGKAIKAAGARRWKRSLRKKMGCWNKDGRIEAPSEKGDERLCLTGKVKT